MPDRAPRPGDDAHGPRHDDFDERLRAVERALTETDRDLTEIATAADRADRLDDLDRRLSAVEDQVADLEAAVQAVRGYVGAVRAVNRDVERRADAALAAARAGGRPSAGEGPPADDERPTDEVAQADGNPASTDAMPADDGAERDPIAIDAPDGKAHLREPTPDPEGDPDRDPEFEDRDPVFEDRDPDDDTGSDSGDRTGADPDHRAGPETSGEDPGGSRVAGESDERRTGDGTGESDERHQNDGSDDHQWPWEREDDDPGRETVDDDRNDDLNPSSDFEDPVTSTPTAADETEGEGESDQGEAVADGPHRDRFDENRDPEPAGDGADSPDPTGRRSFDPPSGRPIQTGTNRPESAGEFEWPPGDDLDVDRAQPWSVPDVPPSEAPDEKRSLLERIREAL